MIRSELWLKEAVLVRKKLALTMVSIFLSQFGVPLPETEEGMIFMALLCR
ncbi:Uncharacterised protein [Shigella dysenteriae]|nr:Uncharacterised protein [Shigella dysenteriae]